jgi:hypothetical protein
MLGRESRTVELYKGDDKAAEEHVDLVLLMVHFFYNMEYPEPSMSLHYLTVIVSYRQSRTDIDLDEPTDKLSPHESLTNESPKDKDELLRYNYVEGWDGTRLKKNAKTRLASRRSTVYCSPSSVILHSRMYALGDYYGINKLKDYALAKFSTAAKLHFTCKEFAEAIYIVYTSTVPQDRGLRDMVTEVFENNLDLLENPEIEARGREIPDLAWDVAKVMHRQYKARR